MIIKRAVIEKDGDVVIYKQPQTSIIESEGALGPQGEQGIPGIGGDENVIEDTRSDHVIVSATIEDFYKGFAPPGTLESAAAWRIFRRRITTTGDEVDIEDVHADDTGLYDKIWANRLSYTY